MGVSAVWNIDLDVVVAVEIGTGEEGTLTDCCIGWF